MAIRQTAELEHLMQQAFDKKASLFYLMPDEPAIFRVGGSTSGQIERGTEDTFTAKQITEIATAAFGEEALKNIGVETGQLRTLCTLPGVIDGQMSVSKAGGDFVITFLLLPTSLPDAGSIRIPIPILEAAKSKNGLILFSGPTGSGKTTSLFCTLDFINQERACVICTLEYMLAYHLTPKRAMIQQREIGTDVPDLLTGLSVTVGQLTGTDVLMIGELRTSEEVRMSTIVSQNSLVLTQLHTKTPEGTIQRMIDIFPEEQSHLLRRMLAENLRCVCAQKLLERADGKGQVAIYGVLIPDDEMRLSIREGSDIMKRKRPLPQGCQTMMQDIENLCSQGIITEKTKEKAIMEF